MTQIKHIAWTGGSAPRPVPDISVEEYQYAMELYFADREEFRAYWKDYGLGDEKEYNDMFWNRARHNAHATFRKRRW